MSKLLITKKDLQGIISMAKLNMSTISLPLHVSDKEVEHGEIPTVAVIESVLTFLNTKGLLTDLVNVDYTDPGCAHDNEPPLESIK